MSRFEHMVKDADNSIQTLRILRELGSQGWQLCCAYPHSTGFGCRLQLVRDENTEKAYAYELESNVDIRSGLIPKLDLESKYGKDYRVAAYFLQHESVIVIYMR